MFSKVKSLVSHPYVQQFRDARALGLVVFCVIALLVTYSGLGAIQTNYKLRQQIAKINELNAIQELENSNLKLRNQYYSTDEYLEIKARQNFGKAAPGETVTIVPKNVAMKYTVDPPQETKSSPETAPSKPFYQRNFEAWVDFFFHRKTVKF